MTIEEFEKEFGFSLEEALNAEMVYWCCVDYWGNKEKGIDCSEDFYFHFVDKQIILIDEYDRQIFFDFSKYGKDWSFNKKDLEKENK